MNYTLLLVIVGISTAFANIFLAFMAFKQIKFIRNEYKPTLTIQKLSPTTFVLFNLGPHPAFNISIFVKNIEKKAFYPLDAGEYFEVKLSQGFLSKNNINVFDGNQILKVIISSKYHKNVKYIWEIDKLDKMEFTEANKYKTQIKDTINFK